MMRPMPLARALLLLAVAGLATAPTAAAQPEPTVQRLEGHDTEQLDQFGAALDLRDDLAVVVAPFEGFQSQGAFYLFRHDPATDAFVEEAKIPGQDGTFLIGFAAALLGGEAPGRELVLVGTLGSARLWRRSAEGAWAFEFSPNLPGDEYEGGGSGVALMRDGDGAEYAAVADGDSVFVYRRAPGTPEAAESWALDGGLSVAGGVYAGTVRGWTAPDGSVAVAVLDREAQTGVAVFRRSLGEGAEWVYEARLTRDPGPGGLTFGHSMAVDRRPSAAERIVVGAPDRQSPYDQPGRVFSWTREAGGAWVEEPELPNQGLQYPTSFGVYTAVDGGIVVATSGSYIQTFRREGDGWTETGAFVPQDYGAVNYVAPAKWGDRLLIGYEYDEALGSEAGAAWVFTLPPAYTPTEDTPTTAALAVSAPHPNPSRGAASVAVTLAAPAELRVEVVDALGRRVAVAAEGARAAGTHRVALGPALAPGAYVVRAEAGGEAVSRPFVVVR